MKNLNNIQSVFNKIREIPYRIPLYLWEENHCCSWKCIQLKNELEYFWVISRYRVCEFYRSNCQLPLELLNLCKNNLSTHVFLEVNIDNERIIVDPTWDSWLKKIFLINEWNNDNQYFAIKPIRFYNLNESNKVMTVIWYWEDDSIVNYDFYSQLNLYLEQIRNAQ